MSKPMERPTGAVEEQKIEGDSPPLSPPGNRDQTSSGKSKPGAREMVADMIQQAVEQAVDRRFQSAKDKRWAELEKQYGSLSELAEKLNETQADADEEAPETDKTTAPAHTLAERVQALAKLPGLKENEDARAMLLRHARPDGIEDYTVLLEDLLKLGSSGQSSESNKKSTPASAVIPGGSDAPDDLRQAYQRRKRALRPGDINALTALKREFRQKGLDVF